MAIPTAAERYDAEFKRRDDMRGAAAIPLGVLSVLFGLLASMGGRFPLEGPWWWIFWTAFGTATLFLLEAAYYLVRSYHGDTYKYVLSPSEWLKYRQQLADWHEAHGSGANAGVAEAEVELERQYAEYGSDNHETNNRKAEYRFRATTALLLAALFLGVAYIPYMVHLRTTSDQVYNVRIVPTGKE
jgi:hypothetical protein